MVNLDLVVKPPKACCIPAVENRCDVQQFIDVSSLDHHGLSKSAFQQFNGDFVVGRCERKPSDGRFCSSPDETTQIGEFIDIRKALVRVDRALVAVPELLSFFYSTVEPLSF